MAARRAAAPAAAPVRRRALPQAYEALTIEGGLLAPEWLYRVAQLAAPQQAEADYRVKKGLSVRDELGRFWRMAQALWRDFDAGRKTPGNEVAVSRQFVTGLLRDVFEFGTLATSEPVVVKERTYPIGHAALGGRVPVVIAPAGAGLEVPSTAFGDGSRRRSAFGLAQEYLNAADGAQWGLASDGLSLRVLRDNASLTRPAWIEADLQRIFTEERYPDFAALWLLVHESRFGRDGQPVMECALEAWRAEGREEGTRARDKLRQGVEEAILSLGQGFLDQRENQPLRDALKDGRLSKDEYFRQLLRLVYRVIFLLTAEEREVLHAPDAMPAALKLYADGYGLRRLRDRAVKRRAFDRFTDLWDSLVVVFRSLQRGEPRLGLPALAGLFAPEQCHWLDGSKLANERLLAAVFRLSWIRDDAGLARVNWRDMGPEELGSVYESLLELVPVLEKEGRVFAFANAEESKGNARKTSGSYYTPDSLVQVLLDSALEPVIQRTLAANPEQPVEALLQLSIVDPACGSGHFLLAAARRLAAHVARLEANGTPSAQEYRHALRQVVGRCIFGVDLNPMAVELCKVALWMEAVDPGRPLTFLDSHIQHGNALLGTTPELMKDGVPDEAWVALEGDDKKTTSALKKRNKAEAKQDSLALAPRENEVEALAAAVKSLDAASDADASALAKKQTEWSEVLASAAFQHQKLVADAWCAAFVWPKPALPDAVAEAAPTNATWRQLRDAPAQVRGETVPTVRQLAKEYEFFHWHLQFPQVFAKGGFDVVLGNPPWDALLFREEEYFAANHPEIAGAVTAAVRKKLIARMEEDNPAAFSRYRAAARVVDGANAFTRASSRFPLCGVGRVNLFGLFAELGTALLAPHGQLGQVLPSGIVSDDSTKLFFQSVVDSQRLVAFYDFENREGLFPGVHRSTKFGLCVLGGSSRRTSAAEFVFFAIKTSDLKDEERRFSLSPADIALLNPQTRTCPIFRSRRDAELTKAIYRRVPAFHGGDWHPRLRRLLNSADDSAGFRAEPGRSLLPLYEAKYFHQFNHRWATNDGEGDVDFPESQLAEPDALVRPRYWYSRDEVLERFGRDWNHQWVLAWRDIARSTDERTFIASVLPSLAVPHTAKVIFLEEQHLGAVPSLLGYLASFAFDFVARQKIGGTHMSGFIVEQLPVLAPSTYEGRCAWSSEMALHDWLRGRVLELTYTAWDLEPFAKDVGYDGPPFRWDPDRRFLLRCELDAAFFHLYGLSHDDTAYVMDTFPIVRKNDEKAHGEYRTKRVILEIYDAMAEAARTGIPYQTRLDPPPADPRVAHPDTRKKPSRGH